jgi:hypothetical protein
VTIDNSNDFATNCDSKIAETDIIINNGTEPVVYTQTISFEQTEEHETDWSTSLEATISAEFDVDVEVADISTTVEIA